CLDGLIPGRPSAARNSRWNRAPVALQQLIECRLDAGYVTGQVLVVHGGMADVRPLREQRREATATRER
ncbi:MAG TPA: hypothetical protein VH134_14415, partial [Candidatus Dormibacteraeota bacterium]|nr:hypothetical protein [Candidatus Dormibacteraeota bacterium]